jgi:hypothetical protein
MCSTTWPTRAKPCSRDETLPRCCLVKCHSVTPPSTGGLGDGRLRVVHAEGSRRGSNCIRLPSPRGPSPKGRGAELAGDGVADALEDALRHMQDLSVGEPEDGQPQRFKPTVTTEVSLRPRKVLCSVSFDHQAYLIAEEVDRIRTDRMLTPEFQTKETTVPQELPERTLCRRRRAT